MVVGFLLAVPVGLMAEAPPGLAVLYVGLPLAALAVAILWPWVGKGELPAALPTIGILVLLVNLLAAGALGFPGVAGTLWLLLAVGLNLHETAPPGRLPRAAGLAAVAIVMALAVGCYVNAYGPVLEAQGSLHAAAREEAEAEQLARQGKPHAAAPRWAQALQWLERAASADRWAAEPWIHLSRLRFVEWQQTGSRKALERVEESTAAMLRLAPNSFALWLASGDRYAEVFARTGRREAIQQATAAYRRAVELYPNSGQCRAKLAIALWDAGDQAGFDAEASRALELDSLTPHRDKKLRPELRKRLLRSTSRQN